MIDLNTVITLTNGYVTLDKLNPKQFISSQNEEKKTWLDSIEYATMNGILVETKYCMVITDKDQLFSKEGNKIKCSNIEVGDLLDTSDGLDEVIDITNLNQPIEMAKLKTIGTFFANGFIVW